MVVAKKETENLARLVAHMPDKQAAMLLATKLMIAPKTGFLERGVDSNFLRDACERACYGPLSILGVMLELQAIANETAFSRDAGL